MSFDEDKRSMFERRRNILYLISEYLTDIGFVITKKALMDESHLTNEYQICDNIDLDTIYLEFCSYHQLKFGKIPKIIRKIESQSSSTVTVNNTRKSANLKRRSKISKEKSTDNNEEHNKLSELELSMKVTKLTGDQKLTNLENIQTFDLGLFTPNFDHFTPEWKELAQIISRDIIKKPLDIKWENVYGAENAKTVLQEALILPMKYPELFHKTKPWKSLLLHGAPGTGKTLIAKALCTETFGKVTFFNVSSSTIISKWRGESEKFIRVLFEVAKLYSPSIIFIDEIESLASRRDSISEHEASKRFKNEFLILMDGLETDNNSGIFILANTNLPWEIDSAFLRRFERKILIELPKNTERIELIKQFLPFSNSWNKKLLDDIAEMSNGFTGDELRIVCKEVLMMEIRKKTQTNNCDQKQKSIINDITFDKVVNAIKQINPSSKIIFEKHVEWNKKFGNKLF